MKAYIAGGCHEHGRNSFLLEGKEYALLVDCGTMQGSETPNPYLSKEQISKIRYIFLTHSHKDHVGSLNWLYEQGFSGKVYLAKETYEQLPSKPRDYVLLDILEGNTVQIEENLEVTYGRSGHCAGSLWYMMHFDDKKIVFSGDYCEDSQAYICDALRDVHADIALVDCAYGTRTGALENKERLDEYINECFDAGKHLLLPVPPNGRGLDLLKMVAASRYGSNVVVDTVFKQRIEATYEAKHWLKDESLLTDAAVMTECDFDNPTAIFVADGQMKSEKNQILAQKVLEQEGRIVFTGHTDLNSYASQLVNQGQADLLIYSVHQNLEEALRLCEKNEWNQVILTHCSKELPVEDENKYLKLKSKEQVCF